MNPRFCYTRNAQSESIGHQLSMAPTKILRIVLLGLDPPTRRLARGLIEKQSNWSLVGEHEAVGTPLELARVARPNVIVLDHEVLGQEIIPLIQSLLQAVPNTNLLLLTSECSEQDIRAALRAGATGFLTKVEIDTRFVSAVKHVASGQRFLSGQLARLVLRRFLDSSLERTNVRPPLSDLTPRELEIVRLVSLGNGNKQIAAQLGIAVRTAEVHRFNAMKKLNLHNLAELVHFAVSCGLV